MMLVALLVVGKFRSEDVGVWKGWLASNGVGVKLCARNKSLMGAGRVAACCILV